MELYAWLTQPWPWYVTGPLLGLFAPGLLVVLRSAIVGTWAYGMLRPNLPH